MGTDPVGGRFSCGFLSLLSGKIVCEKSVAETWVSALGCNVSLSQKDRKETTGRSDRPLLSRKPRFTSGSFNKSCISVLLPGFRRRLFKSRKNSKMDCVVFAKTSCRVKDEWPVFFYVDSLTKKAGMLSRFGCVKKKMKVVEKSTREPNARLVIRIWLLRGIAIPEVFVFFCPPTKHQTQSEANYARLSGCLSRFRWCTEAGGDLFSRQ